MGEKIGVHAQRDTVIFDTGSVEDVRLARDNDLSLEDSADWRIADWPAMRDRLLADG